MGLDTIQYEGHIWLEHLLTSTMGWRFWDEETLTVDQFLGVFIETAIFCTCMCIAGDGPRRQAIYVKARLCKISLPKREKKECALRVAYEACAILKAKRPWKSSLETWL